MKNINKLYLLTFILVLFSFSVHPLHSSAVAREKLVKLVDKKGATIKGVITAQNRGIKGVRVSDGVRTTITDQNGHYWLTSDKKHGYVFIIIPSGYEALPTDGVRAFPRFWSTLTADKNTVEQHDFDLAKVDNDKHIMLVAADLHLANRDKVSADMSQFDTGFMAETRLFIEENKTIPVYTMILGDMTWDVYWYANSYTPIDYKRTISKYAGQVFHVMGNHDNDYYEAGDFAGEAKYKQALGPTYYSMNIGKVHYIVLDNVVSMNTGAMQGKGGARDMEARLTEEQLQWLRDDLAALGDKEAPIVVGFHCPSHSNNNAKFETKNTFNGSSTSTKEDEMTKFIDCFKGFSNVQFLSGHTHLNINVSVPNTSIKEQNIASVCETWWWAGKVSGVNVCRDGSPGGYKVFNVDNENLTWYYKGIGLPRNKQFNTYDVSKVKEFFASAEVAEMMDKLPKSFRKNDYEGLDDNSVLINVWDYSDGWKISIKENGKELPIERLFIKDPLHRLAYDYGRTAKNKKAPTNTTFFTKPTAHMFCVTPKSSTSTLEIVVTSSLGDEYTETMMRPKAYGIGLGWNSMN